MKTKINLEGWTLAGCQITLFLFSNYAVTQLVTDFASYYQFLFPVSILYFIYSCIGGTLFLHRVMSHRHPIPSWIKKVFTLLTIPMISGSPLGWAAVHRTHHANEDTENDPHSPLFNSIWWIHFLSITYQPKSIRLIVDLLKDSFQVKFHRIYVYVCLAWIVGLFIILSVDYFAFFVALPSTVTWHLGSAINSIGHSKKLLGPTNRNWLSLITFGEGSHKNHHEDPKSLRFNKNSLLDFGGFILSKIRSK